VRPGTPGRNEEIIAAGALFAATGFIPAAAVPCTVMELEGKYGRSSGSGDPGHS
jgi:hypothetical protein